MYMYMYHYMHLYMNVLHVQALLLYMYMYVLMYMYVHYLYLLLWIIHFDILTGFTATVSHPNKSSSFDVSIITCNKLVSVLLIYASCLNLLICPSFSLALLLDSWALLVYCLWECTCIY